jgi:hypothetical protein
MDEKKANPYHEGLTIQLQDRLVQSPNLSYSELVSAAIDQERTMKVVVEAEEKKRKRMMPRSSVKFGSSGAPPKFRMVYTPQLGVRCANLNSSSIGAISHNTNNSSSSHSSSSNSNSSTMLLPHCRSRLQSGHHSRFPTIVFPASTPESWDISPMSATCESIVIHHEL